MIGVHATAQAPLRNAARASRCMLSGENGASARTKDNALSLVRKLHRVAGETEKFLFPPGLREDSQSN